MTMFASGTPFAFYNGAIATAPATAPDAVVDEVLHRDLVAQSFGTPVDVAQRLSVTVVSTTPTSQSSLVAWTPSLSRPPCS
jgi:hypothetical protein